MLLFWFILIKVVVKMKSGVCLDYESSHLGSGGRELLWHL